MAAYLDAHERRRFGGDTRGILSDDIYISNDILTNNILSNDICKLKIIKFNAYCGDKIYNNMCYVCHENFNDDHDIAMLHCGHIFHKKCMEEWMKIKKNCPTCRSEKIEILN